MVERSPLAQARGMTTTPPDTPTETTTESGPRASREEIRDLGRLRRSRTDRKIAGVAGGLARHLDIDPLILRVAFVVLIFFGGAGLIVYGACWLLVPDEATGSAPVRLDERSRSVALVVVGVLAVLALLGDSWGGYDFPWPLAVVGIVALVVLSRRDPAVRDQAAPSAEDPASAPYVSSPAGGPGLTAPRPPSPARPRNPRKKGPILFWFTLALVVFSEGVLGTVDLAGAGVADSAYPALAVGLIGLVLVLGAFLGRAGGLILAGLLATAILTGSTISDNWDGADLRETPTRAAAVSGRYSVDAGKLVLDLREVADPANLDGRTIAVEGGVGYLHVILPADLDARVRAAVNGAGDIDVFGQNSDGFDIGLTRSYDGGDDVPAITIDAELGVGQIEVTH